MDTKQLKIDSNIRSKLEILGLVLMDLNEWSLIYKDKIGRKFIINTSNGLGYELNNLEINDITSNFIQLAESYSANKNIGSLGTTNNTSKLGQLGSIYGSILNIGNSGVINVTWKFDKRLISIGTSLQQYKNNVYESFIECKRRDGTESHLICAIISKDKAKSMMHIVSTSGKIVELESTELAGNLIEYDTDLYVLTNERSGVLLRIDGDLEIVELNKQLVKYIKHL